MASKPIRSGVRAADSLPNTACSHRTWDVECPMGGFTKSLNNGRTSRDWKKSGSSDLLKVQAYFLLTWYRTEISPSGMNKHIL